MSSRLLSNTLRHSASKLAKPAVFRGASFAIANTVRTSISAQRFLSTPSSESNLKKVLESELQEIADISNKLDEESQSFIKDSGFEVIQQDGSVVVQLTKQSGDNEVLHVFFDVDDVTNIPNEMAGEEGEQDGFEGELEAIDELLCNARVVIENKANNTALFVNLFLENEAGLVVDHFNVQQNATQFLENASKGDFSELVHYGGPSFSMLDESLQITFEEYLESKGITSELADFITSYSEYKEEKEYRKWLGDVKTFF